MLCLLCGVTFTPKRVDTRYCSRYCMDRAKVLADPIRVAQRRSLHYQANREVIAKKQASYYFENKEEYKRRFRRYYEVNRDAIALYQRQYAQEHARDISARNHARYLVNIEAIREYRAKNKLRIAASMARWSQSNPDTRRENESRRRVRLTGNGIFSLSSRDFRSLHNARSCAHCEDEFTTDKPKHIDHILPIAKGGRHSIGNLQPLCGHCNTSKNDQFYSVWRYRGVTGNVKSRSPCLHEVPRYPIVELPASGTNP
jgi:5-methylcytosine-specific restriction endonuclease McrA